MQIGFSALHENFGSVDWLHSFHIYQEGPLVARTELMAGYLIPLTLQLE